MASRKKSPPVDQLGLAPPSTVGPLPPSRAHDSPAELGRDEPVDLDAFDDYDDEPPARLRLVDPPRPSPRVVVEAIGVDLFEVSRLRDSGTTVACVSWRRDELLELIRRVEAALKM